MKRNFFEVDLHLFQHSYTYTVVNNDGTLRYHKFKINKIFVKDLFTQTSLALISSKLLVSRCTYREYFEGYLFAFQRWLLKKALNLKRFFLKQLNITIKCINYNWPFISFFLVLAHTKHITFKLYANLLLCDCSKPCMMVA